VETLIRESCSGFLRNIRKFQDISCLFLNWVSGDVLNWQKSPYSLSLTGHLICRVNSFSVDRRIRNFQGSTFSLDFLHIWFLLLPSPANYPRTSEIEIRSRCIPVSLAVLSTIEPRLRHHITVRAPCR